jgi:hypothetical protein
MMKEIEPANVKTFLERFHHFEDGIIRNVSIRFRSPKTLNEATIVCSVRDGDDESNWCNVSLTVSSFSDCAVAEGSTTHVILSQGLQIGWFSGKIFLDFSPYTSEPDGEEDFRRSQFYFAGARAVYEVVPYEE